MSSVASAVQILFWLVVATITVLTFLQARKTLFQPQRTEVFKLQVALLAELSAHFVRKDENDLVRDFDFLRIIRINSVAMYDTFLWSAFSSQERRHSAV